MFRRFNYERRIDDEICLFILQNKLKNIIVIVVNLTFIMTRDAKRAQTKCFKNVIDMFFLKKTDEKSVEEFSDVEKNDLFYNVVTQQFRRSDARETCNNEQQMKSFFKFLMNTFEKLQEKNSMIIRVRN